MQVEPNPSARPANNFNLLRLIFASSVILSHSPEMVDGDQRREPISRIFGEWMSLGQLAVDGFFILSGYLIFTSWRREPHLFSFLSKRALRIYPAFVVAMVISAFIFGPLGTNRSYWDGFPNWKFVRGTATLSVQMLPHGFVGLPHPDTNGPAWTIRYEAACYLLIAAIGTLGLSRSKWFTMLGAVAATIWVGGANVRAGPHPEALRGDRTIGLSDTPIARLLPRGLHVRCLRRVDPLPQGWRPRRPDRPGIGHAGPDQRDDGLAVARRLSRVRGGLRTAGAGHGSRPPGGCFVRPLPLCLADWPVAPLSPPRYQPVAFGGRDVAARRVVRLVELEARRTTGPPVEAQEQGPTGICLIPRSSRAKRQVTIPGLLDLISIDASNSLPACRVGPESPTPSSPERSRLSPSPRSLGRGLVVRRAAEDDGDSPEGRTSGAGPRRTRRGSSWARCATPR